MRYGKFYADGRTQLVHRYAYEWANGPIPDGLVIDHLCRVTACVNPDHLEPFDHAAHSSHHRRAHP